MHQFSKKHALVIILRMERLKTVTKILVDYRWVLPNLADNIFRDLEMFNKEELIKMCSALSAYLLYGEIKENISDLFKRCTCTVEGSAIFDAAKGNYENVINRATTPKVYLMILDKCHRGIKHSETDNFLMILKLYLYLNAPFDKGNKILQQIKKIDKDSEFFFQRIYWPFLFAQVEANHNSNFISEYCKTVILLRFMEKNYNDVLQCFLKNMGVTNRHNYGDLFLHYLFGLHNSIYNGRYPYCTQRTDANNKIFDCLLINNMKNPTLMTLKSNPLFYDNNMYYILDWNQLAAQIYIGTYMALKKMLEKKGDKTANKLKGILGQEMERSYFKPIMKLCFSHSNHILKFDSDFNYIGLPDCIMKCENNIFIFEFKDNLFSEDVQNSQDFTSYCNTIDNTYVVKINSKGKTENKAVAQLITYANLFIHNNYSEKKCKEISLSHERNINIYPIIVYTDYKYCVQGVNNYLNTKFQNMLENKNFNDLAKSQIKPVSFISIDFFLNNLHCFNNGKILLNQLIDNYHYTIENQVKEYDCISKINPDKGYGLLQNLYKPFEHIVDNNKTVIPPKENIMLLQQLIGQVE